MSNVILPTLYTLGVDQFNQEYNYTNVLRYILSSLLKSSLTTSKELAEYLDTSVRQAQRYIFNNFKADKVITFNLDTIGEILEYLGISYSGLFSQVEYFISGEYAGVCYDDSLQPIYYTSLDFDKSKYDLEELRRTLITLRKNKYYDITDAQRSVLLTDLTRYPSIFIKEVNQHIR